MKLFSHEMGLSRPQNGFEFFDLDITNDTRLFIDPYYFVHRKHPTIPSTTILKNTR